MQIELRNPIVSCLISCYMYNVWNILKSIWIISTILRYIWLVGMYTGEPNVVKPAIFLDTKLKFSKLDHVDGSVTDILFFFFRKQNYLKNENLRNSFSFSNFWKSEIADRNSNSDKFYISCKKKWKLKKWVQESDSFSHFASKSLERDATLTLFSASPC